MLVVRTDHDAITHYMFHWSIPVINEAENKGFRVTKIDGVKALKGKILSCMEALKPDFVFLNGHGNNTVFYGNDKCAAITLSEAHVFTDTISFVRSCNSATELGEKAVSTHNCQCFIGYKSNFWNAYQNEKYSQPLNDPVSRPVMETSNLVPLHLIRGDSTKESVEASHRAAEQEIEKAIFSSDPYSKASLRALIINDHGLHFHGDENARLVQ